MEGSGTSPIFGTCPHFHAVNDRLLSADLVFLRDTNPRMQNRIANFPTAVPFISVSDGID
jgi:hypothetical protein